MCGDGCGRCRSIHPSTHPSNKQARNTYCRNHLSRNSDIIWSPLGSKHHVLVYSMSLDSTLVIKHGKAVYYKSIASLVLALLPWFSSSKDCEQNCNYKVQFHSSAQRHTPQSPSPCPARWVDIDFVLVTVEFQPLVHSNANSFQHLLIDSQIPFR